MRDSDALIGHVLDDDSMIGFANGDSNEMRRAHHHAFDDRLTANAGEFPLRVHFFLYLFMKRSTRPSVSSSLCLPV